MKKQTYLILLCCLIQLFSFVKSQQKRGNECFLYTSCGMCAQMGCGWCAQAQICFPISSIQIPNYPTPIPTQTVCSTFLSGQWITSSNTCPIEPACRSKVACLDCTSVSGCGYCSIQGMGICVGPNTQTICSLSQGTWSTNTTGNCPPPNTCVERTSQSQCITDTSCGYCSIGSTSNLCLPRNDQIHDFCSNILGGTWTQKADSTTQLSFITTSQILPPPQYISSSSRSNKRPVLVVVVVIFVIIGLIIMAAAIAYFYKKKRSQPKQQFLQLQGEEEEESH